MSVFEWSEADLAGDYRAIVCGVDATLWKLIDRPGEWRILIESSTSSMVVGDCKGLAAAKAAAEAAALEEIRRIRDECDGVLREAGGRCGVVADEGGLCPANDEHVCDSCKHSSRPGQECLDDGVCIPGQPCGWEAKG